MNKTQEIGGKIYVDGKAAEKTQAQVGNTVAGSAIRWALASLSLATLLPALSTSIASVSLPTLAQTFNATVQEVQWIVLAYLLATTAFVLSVGRLGDIIGRRRLLLAGLVVFTAASAVCSIAATLWLLIAARAIQGLGAAIILALSLAVVGETVPKEKTGSAMGLLGTMSAVGTALGPSLGGLLIAGLGWQAIFLINIPLGILAFFLAWRYLPLDRQNQTSKRASFDIAGTLVLALMLSAYALAMTLGRGQFGLLNIGLLIGAGCGVAVFIFTEAKVAAPLIRLGVFRNPLLSAGFATSGLVATVVMATLVVGPFYLAHGLGLDPAFVGLVMSCGPLAVALTSIPAGRVVDRVGAQRMTVTGLVGMVVGSGSLALLPAEFGIPGYILPLITITGGYALFQTATSTTVMKNIPAEQRGSISGMLNLARNLGLITGSSVMGAIFAFALGTSDITKASATAVAGSMRTTFAIAAGLVILALAIVLVSSIFSRRNNPSMPDIAQ